MSSILSGVLAITVVLIAGTVAWTGGRGRRRLSETLLFGPLVVYLAQLALSVAGVGLSRVTVPVMVCAAALLASLVRRALLTNAASQDPDVALTSRAPFWIPVLGLSLVVLAIGMSEPIMMSDPVQIYAPPALEYFGAGRLDPALLHHLEDPSHLDYPPLYTSNMTWVFTAAGGYDPWLVKPLGSMFFMGLVLELIALARLLGVRRPVLAGLVFGLLPATLKEATSGFADIAVTAYLAGAMVSLVRLQRTGDGSQVLRAALMLAGAACTKNEGAAAAVLLLLLIVLIPGRVRIPFGKLARCAGLVVVLALPWFVWVRTQSLENDLVEGFASVTVIDAAERIPAVAQAFVQYSLRSSQWVGFWGPWLGLVFPALAATWLMVLVLAFRRRLSLGSWHWWFPAAHLALFFTVFVFTPRELAWHLPTALPRLLMQCVPAAALAVFSLLGLMASHEGRGWLPKVEESD